MCAGEGAEGADGVDLGGGEVSDGGLEIEIAWSQAGAERECVSIEGEEGGFVVDTAAGEEEREGVWRPF